MKKNLILIPLFFISIFSLHAQTEDELITKVRERFNTINSFLDSYESIEKDIYGESAEGGWMKAYHIDGETVMLHCKFYGEMGNITEYYYYDNSSLFFVFTIKEIYSAPAYLEESEVVSKEENRYYFHNKKMIRWLDNDRKKIDKNSKEFKEKETEILNDAIRMIEVFNEN